MTRDGDVYFCTYEEVEREGDRIISRLGLGDQKSSGCTQSQFHFGFQRLRVQLVRENFRGSVSTYIPSTILDLNDVRIDYYKTYILISTLFIKYYNSFPHSPFISSPTAASAPHHLPPHHSPSSP